MRVLGHKTVLLILLVVVGGGAFLRFWNLGGRAFWRDEAWVATALRERSYGQLLRQTEAPLPPLFAVTAKLGGWVASPAELGYRIPSAVWGVLALPLLYATARTLRAPRTVALSATALAATSVMLVIWSRELKQYSFEGFVSVLIALLVFRARRARTGARRCTLGAAIALTAFGAPWYAYGAVFPIAATLPLLLVMRPRAGSRLHSMLIGASGLVMLAIGVLSVWSVAAGHQATAPVLQKYMSRWFVHPLDAGSWVRAAGYAAGTTGSMLFPADWCVSIQTELDIIRVLFMAGAVWALALCGLVLWPRRGRFELLAWVFGTWLTTLIAALAHQYPFANPRMMLFCVPPLVLAATAGAVLLARGLCRMFHGRGGAALVAGMFLGALPLVYVVHQPLTHRLWVDHDFPAALRMLQQQRQPGEWVYVETRAAPCVRYYAPDLPDPAAIAPIGSGTLPSGSVDALALARNSARAGGARLWILTTEEPRGNLDDPVLDLFRQSGYDLEPVARYGMGSDEGGTATLLLARRR